MKKLNVTRLQAYFKKNKRLVIAVVPLVTVMAIFYSTEYRQTGEMSNVTATNVIDTTTSDLLSLEQVQSLAQAADPTLDTMIQNVELTHKGETLLYTIYFKDNTSMLIDAYSGVRIADRVHTENNEGSEAIPKDFIPSLSFTQARNVARTKNPQGSINRIHLDMEHGSPIYSVQFVDNSHIDVDAANGTIMKVKDNHPDAKLDEPAKREATDKNKKSLRPDAPSHDSNRRNTHGLDGAAPGRTHAPQDKGRSKSND